MARPDQGQVVAWYVCTVTACTFLVCRLVVRVRLLKRLYLDDLFVTMAALCLIGDLAIQHYMFNQGESTGWCNPFGRSQLTFLAGMSDMANSTMDQKINMMKMIIPGSTLYVTSLWLIKSSMVIFYKRLADRTRYQLVYNITLGTLAATWLVLFFDIIFKCYPPRRQWQGLLDAELTCPEGPSTINYWLTILFICLPISQVARLKMPTKQKWGVISVFLLGVFVVITSSTLPYHYSQFPIPFQNLTMLYPVIRAVYSHLGEQMITCTVSMIETAIAIIASCLPVLRTLVFGSHSRTGTYSSRRGYELSHAGVHTGAQDSKQQTSVSASRSQVDRGADDVSFNDSEDGLVKETGPRPGIAVTHEYFVHEDARTFRG
ncbi:unnamed protein product [Penicillium salamii]|uniref:Rhodopsin domain-containing protein n=1 Tax=Penicillium salamii TaxID=1612424 RepID=A0A9W4NFJ0_9EURO|nr:unnamed protein product [Penicillium salamii]CAG8360008.1 unnamed protein product [Penicillium salamii]CAG8425840.1 unnamed protein product [Penicillium salamii]